MIAMNFIEFMMFICIPAVFVPFLLAGLWGEFSRSDSAVKKRQEYQDRYGDDELDYDDHNYILEEEQLQYFRNETFDRQQGKNR